MTIVIYRLAEQDQITRKQVTVTTGRNQPNISEEEWL